jgi:soluble lytic murein transglycosylase-like protein
VTRAGAPTREASIRVSGVACAALLALVPPPLAAAIWGYVDAQGIPHVASEQLDERYTLIYKGASTADLARETAQDDELEALRQSPLYQRIVSNPRAASLDPLVTRSAAAQGLDVALVKAVIAVESGFVPDAVSARGAIGLMQVVPETAARYGLVAGAHVTLAQKLADPGVNLRIGTRYLHDLMTLFEGDVALALAAYNAGEQTVERYHRRIPPFPETEAFVRLVQQFRALYQPASAPAAPARIKVPRERGMLGR